MVTKDQVLSEIRRTAQGNGGVALGQQAFFSETGIKISDWRGRYWAKWGDAVREAGFEPQEWRSKHDDDAVLGKVAAFVTDIGRFPTVAELQLKRRGDVGFPSKGVFNRLGPRRRLAQRVVEFCDRHPGYDGVRAVCLPIATETGDDDERIVGDEEQTADGFVYLLKSGRFYKIGRTNAPGRRERELQIQLPEPAKTVHEIRTDDPVGIEDNWHRRFTDRRMNGEWFELTTADVGAFKRRRFM
jgi:hypothetical protein